MITAFRLAAICGCSRARHARFETPRTTRFFLVAFAWLVFFCAPSPAAPATCQVAETTYRGWKCFQLSNSLVTLHVVPEIGGRIIQFQLADHPFLFVDPNLAGKVFPPAENGGGEGGWKNYGGSKLWPAPQGWERDDQWPGPPDPVLDGGVYDSKIVQREDSQVAVSVTSPPDARTGIQLSRVIHLFPGSTRVRHDCSMSNISRRPVRWSIWEVIQLDAGARTDPAGPNTNFWAYCPLNPQSSHPKGFAPLFGQVNHPSWRPDYTAGLLAVKYEHRVGKVGLDSNAGWFAAVDGQSDYCFVGKFQWFAQATYPDVASVEFWLNGAGELIINGVAMTNSPSHQETPYYMEAEMLSPMVELQPGEDYQFRIDWFATRCPKPIIDVTSTSAIHEPFRISVRPNSAVLTGVSGVFVEGRVQATVFDALGNPLAREDLGPVHPAQVFRLNRELVLPTKAFRVSLRLIDNDGQDCGPLGTAVLPES